MIMFIIIGDAYFQTDMNQTVESLSMRVVQLQTILVEAEELQEETEAARKDLDEQLKESQTREKGRCKEQNKEANKSCRKEESQSNFQFQLSKNWRSPVAINTVSSIL